jgi:hypothetical protein
MPENISQSWYKRWPSTEFAETIVLNCEEYGLLQRFRDHSIVNNGIEDDQELIQRLGARFGLSRYKLKKLWPRIENFFTLRDQRFVYEQDEQERHQLFIIRGKRQLAGRLGAQARWSERDRTASDGENVPMANAMANAISLPSGLPSEVEVEVESRREVSSAAAITRGHAASAAAAAESPPTTQASQELTNPHDDRNRRAFEALSVRCAELQMPVPSPDLAVEVVKKFTHLSPEEAARALPRFPDQRNAALWLSKSVLEIELEAARQATALHGDRKPTAKEQHQQHMLERARQVDAKRQGGSG